MDSIVFNNDIPESEVFVDNEPLRSLFQCTPDVSRPSSSKLRINIDEIEDYFYVKIQRSVLNSFCTFRQGLNEDIVDTIDREVEQILNELSLEADYQGTTQLTFTVEEVSRAVWRVRAKECHSVEDIATINRILNVCCVGILSSVSNCSADSLKVFLQRFGPLEVAFQKARNFIFDEFGYLSPGYWGFISKAEANRVLSCQPPGYYILRAPPKKSSKLIISFVSQLGKVHHCGLRNGGFSGYQTSNPGDCCELNIGHSLNEKYVDYKPGFLTFRDFIRTYEPLLTNVLPCPHAHAWNQTFWCRKSISALEEDKYTQPQIYRSGAIVAKDIALSRCNTNNDNMNPNASSKTNKSSVSDSDDTTGLKPSNNFKVCSYPSGYVKAGLLESLLQHGAEKFRDGKPDESETIFRQVLKYSTWNLNLYNRLAWSHKFSADTPGHDVESPLNESGIFDSQGLFRFQSNRHKCFAARCKCESCASFRARAKALANLGHICLELKRVPDAVFLYESSLFILREMGMWGQEHVILSSLTTCSNIIRDPCLRSFNSVQYYGTRSRSSERKDILSRLIVMGAINIKHKSTYKKGARLILYGDVLYSSQAILSAISVYKQALFLSRCAGDDLIEVHALLRLGECLFKISRLRDAIVVLERAVLLALDLYKDFSSTTKIFSKDLFELSFALVKRATTFVGWKVPRKLRGQAD